MSNLDKAVRATLALENKLTKDAPNIAREISHEQWLKEGKDRFGPDMSTWKFVCPSCGHIASVADYVEAGKLNGLTPQRIDGYVGYSCIGRLLKGDDAKTFQKSGGPCMYSGGGLVRLNPVRVVMSPSQKFPEGTTRDVFEWAPVIAFVASF